MLRTLPRHNTTRVSNTTMIIAASFFVCLTQFSRLGLSLAAQLRHPHAVQRQCRRKRVGPRFTCVDHSGAQPSLHSRACWVIARLHPFRQDLLARRCLYLCLVDLHFDLELFELSHLLGSSLFELLLGRAFLLFLRPCPQPPQTPWGRRGIVF